MYSIVAEESGLLPRERLLQKGAEVLSDQELLAIVLRTGTRSESVLSMANRILKGMTSLADLSRLSLNELQKIPGIGRVKSIELKAMVELAKRIEKAELARSEQIMSSQQVARRMMLDIGDKPQEHLVAIYLDTQNRIIQQKTVFIGGVRRSIAEPREILHYACHLMATSLIVVHNHPSGAVAPSRNDDHVTKLVKEACDLMGIVLLDHLIVSYSSYFSYREKTDLI